jgi:NAD(P)H dehydrogenase (quinone)
MTIAIFGATGHLGGLVIDSLIGRGIEPGDILALGRNEERLAGLAARGLRTARVDLADPAGLPAVLAGVQKALLISASEPGARVAQHRAVIDAAAEAGVGHLAYTSILRNGWYTENYAQDFALARQTGVIVNSVGDGRIATAPRSDYAEAAAVVLTEPGHEGAVYELSGDNPWNYTEFAQAAQEVLGTPVRYEAVTAEQEREQLRALGLDEGTADFVSAMNASIRENALALSNGDLARLIGHPTQSLAETFRTWV